MSIVYRSDLIPDTNQLLKLYKDANWLIYTNDPAKLLRALRNSKELITAWRDGHLIGLIRTVGDGETIIYIQDLLVLNAERRKGVGSNLMQHILDANKSVRQIVLLTDDQESTRKFYKSMMFKACDDGVLIAFAKISP